MQQPQDLSPIKYKEINLLYNHNHFSVSVGPWTPNNFAQIARRRNYGGDVNGYPKVFANPQWFLTSDDIAINLLHSLLSIPLIISQKHKLILDALTRI